MQKLIDQLKLLKELKRNDINSMGKCHSGKSFDDSVRFGNLLSELEFFD